jgi:hypothetical protein
VNDEDPNSLLAHCPNKTAAGEAFADIVLKAGLEDRCVVVTDMVSDLGALAAANGEAEAATGPDQVGIALVLDDIHLTIHRRSAYSQMVKNNQGVIDVVGGAVASHHSFPTLVGTSFACELDSCLREEEVQKNSLFGIGQGGVQPQKCWKRRHLADSLKHARSHWDGPHSIDLVDSPPYRLPTVIESVSALVPGTSRDRCWGLGVTPTSRSRGQPPRLPIRKSEQPFSQPVDADGFPSYVD